MKYLPQMINSDEENDVYPSYPPRQRVVPEVNSDYNYATLYFKCFDKYHDSNGDDGNGDDGNGDEDHSDPDMQHTHPIEGGQE